MYSHNISTFLRHLLGEEELQFDMEDEITRETLVMRDGQVVHPRIRESDSEGDH
jgi:NAD/NADP transhydrogenase alpha subunit